MFKKNEGSVDRIIRAIVGIALGVYAYLYLSETWQIIGYVIAVILVFTAITGFCGLYKLFGISTTKKSQTPQMPQ